MRLKTLLNSATRGDRILLFLLIILSVLGMIFIGRLIPAGKTVRIYVDNRPVYVLPAEVERTVTVKGPEGETLVEIRKSRVRISASACRNKLCVNQGWIEGGSVICLPNRVVVTLGNSSGETGPAVDAVTR